MNAQLALIHGLSLSFSFSLVLSRSLSLSPPHTPHPSACGIANSCRVGVILDTPGGKNNGTVGGHEYFKCADKHGILSPLNKVERETADTAPTAAGADDGMYDDTEGFQGIVALPTPAAKKVKKVKKVKQADFTYKKVLGRGSFGKVRPRQRIPPPLVLILGRRVHCREDNGGGRRP